MHPTNKNLGPHMGLKKPLINFPHQNKMLKVNVDVDQTTGRVEVEILAGDKRTLRYLLPNAGGYSLINPFGEDTQGVPVASMADGVKASIDSTGWVDK